MIIQKDNLNNYDYGLTHGGYMHADEVFASALLKIINPYFKIYRLKNRDEEIIYNNKALIFDVGDSFYNHHDQYLKFRNNGSKFASFGLILYAFGHQLGLSDEDILCLDSKMVEQMDISDNDGILNDYATIIDRFNVSWNSNNNDRKRFDEAVDTAKLILEREIYNLKNKIITNNTIKDIENVYIDAFLDFFDETLTYENCGYNTLCEVYECYGKEILNKNEIILMKQKILRYQNIINNKKNKAGFIQIIDSYDLNNIFERNNAIKFLKKILLRDILRTKSESESAIIIKSLYLKAKENYIILPKAGMSWSKTVVNLNNSSYSKNIDYILFQGSSGEYLIQCVPKQFNKKTDLRKALPEEWRGKPKEELKKFHKSLIFCHLTGFICGTKSMEDSLEVINILNTIKKES